MAAVPLDGFDGSEADANGKGVTLAVLGNVQDGGYPHIGCERPTAATSSSGPPVTRWFALA